jgi:predicted CXXCH cytochrome family protein
MSQKVALLPLIIGCLLFAGGIIALSQDEVSEDAISPSNAYCLLCHEQTDDMFTFASGETISLHIDQTILANSVHGNENPDGALQCADCHTDHLFPHAPIASTTIRDFQLERYATCRNCHEDQYTKAQDSVHGESLRLGVSEAAVCVDCHGGHDIQTPEEPIQRMSLTCGKCHGAIFDQYQQSVHGDALLADANPDVPSCIDCHGLHDIGSPEASSFRNRSPQICADCHADDALMEEYDISTHVFDSYLSDFHGTTVALFDQHDPSSVTNKAVCYDCHGVHDITRADAENSRVIRENLLDTCRECHPNASSDFSDSWTGHFPPTLEKNPLLFLVNLFYDILIPVTIGGFLFLIATDIIRRIRERLRR